MDGGDPAGGSAELARLIDEYGEILVPDLKHYYGIDLRDLFSEAHPLSPRYVLSHIKYLPIESAYIAERRGGQHFRGWDESRYLSAALLNSIRAFLHIYIVSHLDKRSSKPKPPTPWPLPDKQEKAPDKPGSFGFITKDLIARAKKRKEGRG